MNPKVFEMRMKLRTKIPVHNNKTYCFDFCLK